MRQIAPEWAKGLRYAGISVEWGVSANFECESSSDGAIRQRPGFQDVHEGVAPPTATMDDGDSEVAGK